MDGKIQVLYSILEQELEIHDQLLQVAQTMNKALKKNETGEIQRTSVHYDELTGRIETLEEKRLQICDYIGKELKKSKGHMNLASITDALPKEDRGPFKKVQDELKAKIAKLTKINTSNQVLLEEALLNIAKAVELIAKDTNKYAGYKQYGKKDADIVLRNIVNKIA